MTTRTRGRAARKRDCAVPDRQAQQTLAKVQLLVKILYGVQGAGNGHTTRARLLGAELAKRAISVDYLFAGRPRHQYFDMESFADWQYRDGIWFHCRAGRLQILKTLTQNSFANFWRDIRTLDLSGYDLVITDFEPISAWAARRQGVPCIGLAHQYAFKHPVPVKGDNFFSRLAIDKFAPADIYLGLHFHHFNAPILPPMVAQTPARGSGDSQRIVVYLNFEEPRAVVDLLQPFDQHRFCVYGPYAHYQKLGHIELNPLSRQKFALELEQCTGVICNAGFELSSEALHLGKKLLVKPLLGQMEQTSNVAALEQLGLATSMTRLDPGVLRDWLSAEAPAPRRFPDVAYHLADHIAAGQWRSPQPLIEQLWAQTSP